MSTDTVARRIVRDLNGEANFAGNIQLVYDRTGKRVGCFPGGNVYVELWSGWDPDYVVFVGGNGRRFTVADVARKLES